MGGAREACVVSPGHVPSKKKNDTELATPDTFLTLRRAAAEEDADIDAALTSLLDGTLGWAEGLEPGDRPWLVRAIRSTSPKTPRGRFRTSVKRNDLTSFHDFKALRQWCPQVHDDLNRHETRRSS